MHVLMMLECGPSSTSRSFNPTVTQQETLAKDPDGVLFHMLLL